MTGLQQAMNQARMDLNKEIEQHYASTGQTPDFARVEFDACIAEDGHTLVLFAQFPDGFTATAGCSGFVHRFRPATPEVH